jgi:ATP-dependent RNA circularization protein (DNA/RNA ligase family)
MAVNPLFHGASWFVVDSETETWPSDGQGGATTTLSGSDMEDVEEVQLLRVVTGLNDDANNAIIINKDSTEIVDLRTTSGTDDIRDVELNMRVLGDVSANLASSPNSAARFYVFYRVVKRTES